MKKEFDHPSSFLLHPLIWYRRRDSNPHCLVPKTSAYSRLGYAGGSKDEGGRMKDEWCPRPRWVSSSLRLHPSSLDWWTWHDLNVRPRPSQSRALIPLSYRSELKDEGGRMKDETEWCGSFVASSFIPHPLSFDMEEGTGVEPASDKCAVVFGTTALPVRLPFQEEFRIANCGFRICSWLFALGPLPFAVLAGTLGFEPRISILETDGLPVSLHP